MLCAECQPKYDAWLEPRQLFIENRLDFNGEDNKRRRADLQRDRFDRWHRIVTNQLDLVISICKQHHQPGQQALFNIEEVTR